MINARQFSQALIDFLRNYICSPKLPFLAHFSLNFSTVCMHMLSKFTKKFAQKSSIFSSKVNYAKSLIIFLFICVPLHIFGADLHAIIITDTREASVGFSAQSDLNSMHKEVENISVQTGLSLKEHVYCDEDVIPEKIIEEIDNLSVAPDDVILFYFSGHGFRPFSKSHNPWPNLYFSLTKNALDLEYFIDVLSAKNAKFLLVLSDTCNNLVPDRIAPPIVIRALAFVPEEHTSISEAIKLNYKKLFLESQGIAIAIASEAGKYSLGDYRGGFFTRFFLLSLEESTHSFAESSWEEIFERTTFQVMEETINQKLPTQLPQYFLYLSKKDY